MPRFFWPLIILDLLDTIFWLYLLFFVSPLTAENRIRPRIIIVFLVSLGLSLMLNLSFLFYVFHRWSGDYRMPRYIYRQSLRQGILVTIGLLTIAVLSLTQTLSFWTFFLTLAVLVTGEMNWRKSK